MIKALTRFIITFFSTGSKCIVTIQQSQEVDFRRELTRIHKMYEARKRVEFKEYFYGGENERTI